MNIKQSLHILELNEKHTIKELKKAYYKKCLQYHPDKNPNGTEMFKKVQSSYEYLNKFRNKYSKHKNKNNFKDEDCYYNSDDNDTYSSYSEMLKKYISMFSEKYNWKSDDIYNVIQGLLNNAKNISFKLFDKLDRDTALNIYEYLQKYKTLFNINQDIIDSLYENIHKKFDDTKIIILKPSIEDLMDDNISVLEINNNTFYVPLWHNELHFKDDYIIKIVPDVSKNIIIDDDNNLHFSLYKSIQELLCREKCEIEIGGKIFFIETNQLYIQKYQTFILKNQGLSKIQDKDIFNNKKRANIVVHIHLL